MENRIIKFVDAGGTDFQFVVVCPICGFEYNQIQNIIIHDSKDNYEAEWQGRGDLTEIKFACEDGHKWSLCFGFHKGNTYTFIK